jgi:hypothetical protein
MEKKIKIVTHPRYFDIYVNDGERISVYSNFYFIVNELIQKEPKIIHFHDNGKHVISNVVETMEDYSIKVDGRPCQVCGLFFYEYTQIYLETGMDPIHFDVLPLPAEMKDDWDFQI